MDSGLWLGGKPDGKYKGRGISNIIASYQMGMGIRSTPEIVEKKDIAWKIRKTANLWEHINSQAVVATR